MWRHDSGAELYRIVHRIGRNLFIRIRMDAKKAGTTSGREREANAAAPACGIPTRRDLIGLLDCIGPVTLVLVRDLTP